MVERTIETFKNDFIKTLNYFIQVASFNNNFKLKTTKNDIKLLERFISKLDKEFRIETLGTSYIFNYISFQIAYWIQLDTRAGKDIVGGISWICGEKAIKRWHTKPAYYMLFVKNNLLHKYPRLSIRKVEKLLEIDYTKLSLIGVSPIEEVEKQRFPQDSNLQLYHCSETTTMYHPISFICITCPKQKECIELTKKEYPKIYQARIKVHNKIPIIG